MTDQETTKSSTPLKRQFNGVVVSTKMQNTVVVRVDSVKIHPRYKKRYTTSKRYPCDYRGNDVKIGDSVLIEEIRPISKTKRWRVVSKTSSKK